MIKININKTIQYLKSIMNLNCEEKDIHIKRVIEELKDEINNNPDDVKAFSLISVLYLELNYDTNLCLKVFDEYYEKNKDSISDDDFALYATNYSYILCEECEEYEKAEELLLSSVNRNSKYPNTYYALGKIYFNKERYEEAAELFNSAYKISKDRVYAYCEAVCLFKMDKKDVCMSKIKSIYKYPFINKEIDGKAALLYADAVFCYDKAESEKNLELILSSDYNRFDIYDEDIAEVMFKIEKFDKCIELYDKASLYVDKSWIYQYFYSLKSVGKIQVSYEKMKEIEENITGNIEDEEYNNEDYESFEEYLEYINSERTRLKDIKEIYNQAMTDKSKQVVHSNYDIIYRCYYIDCPRHYKKMSEENNLQS